MDQRRLGKTDIAITPIGFGAFKIGRNVGIKYAREYDLPTDAEVQALIDGVLELGINYFDTAPAYGTSEERLGRAVAGHFDRVVISTKVGETFERGVSNYDFSERGVRESIERSLKHLRTDHLDLVFIHSDGRDLEIMEETDVVNVLKHAREAGRLRAIGLSGKTVEGARAALDWADAIMVEYHLDDRSHEEVIAEAAARGVGVIVKKGLASGRLPADDAIRFILSNPHVTSLVIGGLNLNHFRANCRAAEAARAKRA